MQTSVPRKTGKSVQDQPVFHFRFHTNSNSPGSVEAYAALPCLIISRPIGTMTRPDYQAFCRQHVIGKAWLVSFKHYKPSKECVCVQCGAVFRSRDDESMCPACRRILGLL